MGSASMGSDPLDGIDGHGLPSHSSCGGIVAGTHSRTTLIIRTTAQAADCLMISFHLSHRPGPCSLFPVRSSQSLHCLLYGILPGSANRMYLHNSVYEKKRKKKKKTNENPDRMIPRNSALMTKQVEEKQKLKKSKS